MIVYPENWSEVGLPVGIGQIEATMEKVVAGIDCNNLSFSGGIDSSLLLYWMLKQGRKVKTYTVACNAGHPDADYALRVIKDLQDEFNTHIEADIVCYETGIHSDEAVVSFYLNLERKGVTDIITGDGIDELMCGYYPHQESPTEETYYSYLRKMQDEQLGPLHQNSGGVRVYIPYMDKRIVDLLVRVPVSEKVNKEGRKLLMQRIAEKKLPQYVIDRRKFGFCTISQAV